LRLEALMATAKAACGAGRLGDGCRFAGKTIEDGASAGGGGGDSGGECFEELGISLRGGDGCSEIIIFLLDCLQALRQWALG